MKKKLAHIALLVKDYDEAIEFYTKKLGFALVEDTLLSADKRWVLIAPDVSNETCLLLAKATTEQQKNSIGNQSGGRVFLFLYTDNFERDFNRLLQHNIKIIRQPVTEIYGTVAVFEDIYGNAWDLIQPANKANQ